MIALTAFAYWCNMHTHTLIVVGYMSYGFPEVYPSPETTHIHTSLEHTVSPASCQHLNFTSTNSYIHLRNYIFGGKSFVG